MSFHDDHGWDIEKHPELGQEWARCRCGEVLMKVSTELARAMESDPKLQRAVFIHANWLPPL